MMRLIGSVKYERVSRGALCLSNAPAATREKRACKQWLSTGGLCADPLERNDPDNPCTGEPGYQSELAAHLRSGCFALTGAGSRRTTNSCRSAFRVWWGNQCSAIYSSQESRGHSGRGPYRLRRLCADARPTNLFLQSRLSYWVLPAQLDAHRFQWTTADC